MKRWDPDLCLGLLLTGLVLLLMGIGLVQTPHDPNAMDAANRFLGPMGSHPLGTDNFGRDNLSRIMLGMRYTFLVAAGTVSIGLLAGLLLGMPAGWFGGLADEAVMRLMDAMTSFPGILLALVMVTVLDNGRYDILIALGILFVPSFTRIARGGVLQYREAEFVKSAQVFGAGWMRILFVHILPNLVPQLLAAVVVGLSNAILAESGMSYLGLGIQPPAASLGRMLSEAQPFLFHSPWGALAPGLAIVTTVLGLNALGEGLGKRFG